MTFRTTLACLALLSLLCGLPPAARADDAPPPAPVADEDAILGLLNQSADWYKAQLATDSLASDQREGTFRDTLKRNGERTLRSAIAFARAEVPLTAPVAATPAPPTAPTAPNQPAPETIDAKANRLQAAATQAAGQAAALTAQLKQTEARLARAGGGQRAALTALRDKQQSALALAQAQPGARIISPLLSST